MEKKGHYSRSYYFCTKKTNGDDADIEAEPDNVESVTEGETGFQRRKETDEDPEGETSSARQTGNVRVPEDTQVCDHQVCDVGKKKNICVFVIFYINVYLPGTTLPHTDKKRDNCDAYRSYRYR